MVTIADRALSLGLVILRLRPCSPRLIPILHDVRQPAGDVGLAKMRGDRLPRLPAVLRGLRECAMRSAGLQTREANQVRGEILELVYGMSKPAAALEAVRSAAMV